MANKDRTEIARCRMAVLGGDDFDALEDVGHELDIPLQREPNKLRKCPRCGRRALLMAEEIPKRRRVPMRKAA